jgi:hypothetical protein
MQEEAEGERERDWLGGRMVPAKEGGKMKAEKGRIY